MNMLAKSLLQELEYEIPATRKTLERVPAKFDWKPHAKSMTMGRLAQHVAEIPDWAVKGITLDEFDLAPVGGQQRPPAPTTTEQVLAEYDKNIAAAKAALAGTTDEHLMKTWTLKMGGNPIMALPRIAVVRNFVLNHNVHHRAQLGVYLRLNDIAVPSVYGPSADEGGM
jgi:uncharacterized damage-inducible protein DinB